MNTLSAVCVCARERESVCVCVCVFKRCGMRDCVLYVSKEKQILSLFGRTKLSSLSLVQSISGTYPSLYSTYCYSSVVVMFLDCEQIRASIIVYIYNCYSLCSLYNVLGDKRAEWDGYTVT